MRTRNPAVARRWLGKTYAPAHLTDTREHFTAEDTRRAQRAVAEVFAGRGVPLGQGNFGAAYRVEVDGAPVLVKMASRRTLHTRTAGDMYGWLTSKYAQGGRSLATAREELQHEAGVSNELWPMGHRVIPATIYAEYKGRPALVREYGQIPANVTPQEYDKLARDLIRVVEDGWAVVDELLVARRPDGSLYIADVGMWRPYNPGPEGTGLSDSPTSTTGNAYDLLNTLLYNFSRTQPWGGNGVSSTLAVALARKKMARNEARVAESTGDPPKLALLNLKYAREKLDRMAAERAAVGLPT